MLEKERKKLNLESMKVDDDELDKVSGGLLINGRNYNSWNSKLENDSDEFKLKV